MNELLLQGLSELGLDVSRAETLERFSSLLLEKNQVMNLTAITEPDAVAQLHLLDSAAILQFVGLKGKKVVDVGTGAGFPGMPLRILEDDFDLTLLDSLGKRVTWLQEVCDELQLKRVACVHARAEEFAMQHREQFDIATSRAVAQLSILSELCLPLIKVGGQFIAMKSVDTEDEIAEGLLRTVIDAGRVAMQDSHNYDAMSEIMWAGSLSHNGLTGLGGNKDFAPHQLGHALSEKFDVYHGDSLTAVWSSWARSVMDESPARFARFARNVWHVEEADDTAAALAGIAKQEAFFQSIGMPVRLGELSCGRQDEAGLADLASRCSYGKTRTIGTFRVLDYESILAIYRRANEA